MEIVINNCINNCKFNENDLQIITQAHDVQDYNLMRVIVEGNLEEVRVKIDEELLCDREVGKYLKSYKALLRLENAIHEYL